MNPSLRLCLPAPLQSFFNPLVVLWLRSFPQISQKEPAEQKKRERKADG